MRFKMITGLRDDNPWLTRKEAGLIKTFSGPKEIKTALENLGRTSGFDSKGKQMYCSLCGGSAIRQVVKTVRDVTKRKEVSQAHAKAIIRILKLACKRIDYCCSHKFPCSIKGGSTKTITKSGKVRCCRNLPGCTPSKKRQENCLQYVSRKSNDIIKWASKSEGGGRKKKKKKQTDQGGGTGAGTGTGAGGGGFVGGGFKPGGNVGAGFVDLRGKGPGAAKTGATAKNDKILGLSKPVAIGAGVGLAGLLGFLVYSRLK